MSVELPKDYRPKPTVLSLAVGMERIIHEENAKRQRQRMILEAFMLGIMEKARKFA